MTKTVIWHFLSFLLGMQVIAEFTLAQSLPPLRVSGDGRILMQGEGSKQKPFLWIGDTAWYLDRLNQEEIKEYFRKRAAQEFTVVQGPVLCRADWQADSLWIDFVVDEAEKNGLYIMLVPAWAQAMEHLDPLENYRFGQWLGQRYRSRNHILWIAGGEAAGETHPRMVEALAAGLEAGHQGRHLMTVHPSGQRSSSKGTYKAGDGKQGDYRFHEAAWLDFNTIQSGHRRDYPTYQLVEKDYGLVPAKPTFESEYFYEDALQWEDRFKPDAYRAK